MDLAVLQLPMAEVTVEATAGAMGILLEVNPPGGDPFTPNQLLFHYLVRTWIRSPGILDEDEAASQRTTTSFFLLRSI